MPKIPRLHVQSIFVQFIFCIPIALCCGDGFNLKLLGQSAGSPSDSKYGSGFEVSTVNGIEFRHPAHLQLEYVSSSELTRWPIVADLDEQGNLLVLESAGVEGGIAKHVETRPHRLVRLLDENHDGRFDRRQIVATDLAFPEGVLSIGKQILVSAPPQIWSLIDEDGDGVCESRSVWFDGGTLTGCGNDLHGPYLGRDGYIYWCKGAFAEQSHMLSNGKQLTTTASHIFRRPIEGGPIDVVMTGGMDNPVEMAMLANGDRFFTSTFLQHPGGGKRDGVVHAIYGGVWGKEHGVIAGHWRTGPLMPITIHLGPAAPSGLTCLTSDSLVEPLYSLTQKSVATPSNTAASVSMLAAAEFNLHRISVHALKQAGSSYEAESKSLLESDRIDFHPTDVLEAPDGSLLIIDTGGWYDLCCPSSAVDQAVAGGGVYRLSLRRESASNPSRQANNFEFASSVGFGLLCDPSAWVRKQAYMKLVSSNELTDELFRIASETKLPIEIRLDAAWGLCRSAQKLDVERLILLLQAEHPSLRQVALHAIALHRWPEIEAVQRCLEKEANLQVLRTALETLGRIGDHGSVSPLMQILPKCQGDVGLRHSLLYALMEVGISNPAEHAKQLRAYCLSADLDVRRAAIWVLDQTAPSELESEWVWSLMVSSDAAVKQEAITILSHHREWADELVSLLAAELDKQNGSIDPFALRLLAEWKDAPGLLKWADARVDSFDEATPIQQQMTIELLQSLSLKSLPKGWSPKFAKWIQRKGSDSNGKDVLLALLGLVSKVELDPSQDAMLIQALVEKSRQQGDDGLRLSFIASLPKNATSDPKLQDWAVKHLLETLNKRQASPSESTDVQPAWYVLERMQLLPVPAKQLASGLPLCSPIEVSAVLAVLSRTDSLSFQRELLNDVLKLQAARTLAPGFLTQLYRKHPKELQERSKQIEQSLQQPSGDVAKKLDEMLAALPAGDPTRGFQVFRNPKQACSACHQLGYVGGSIGPELSKIGATRTRRDLLESILFPSVRFAASYQPTVVQTVDGEVLNGLIRNETTEHIEMVVAADKTLFIPLADIERRVPSEASIMPAGLEGAMSLQDLADLIAMLESKK